MNASNWVASWFDCDTAALESVCALLDIVVVESSVSVNGSDTDRVVVERGVDRIDMPLVLAGEGTAVDAPEYSPASLIETCETLVRCLVGRPFSRGLTKVDL